MLLLQNGYGMKITEYPAHYAGFSTNELAVETVSGLAHFQSYKVTQVKHYLAELSIQQMSDPSGGIKDALVKRLNPDPLIAMAQVNELFLQIKEHKLQVPKGYNPLGFLHFLSGDSKSKNAHTAMLDMLKEVYLDQLHCLIEQAPQQAPSKQIGFETKDGAAKTLMNILNTQAIMSQCDSVAIQHAVEAYQQAVTASSKEEVLTVKA